MYRNFGRCAFTWRPRLLTVVYFLHDKRATMSVQNVGSTGQNKSGFRIIHVSPNLRQPVVSDSVLLPRFGKNSLLRRFWMKIIQFECNRKK